MRLIGLAAGAILMSTGASAEPVTLGPGDVPPARVEITAHRVEVTTHGASSSSSALSRIFVGTIDRTPSGVRRMAVRLARVGAEAVVDDERVRLSGDVELYLLESFKEVELILAFDRNGVVTSVDNWDEARAKILQQMERRAAVMQSERPVIHPAAALAPEAVEQLDRQVTESFLEHVRNMSATDFLETFYPEPGLILIASNERLEIGAAVRRSAVTRGPSDRNNIATTERYRLREVDAGRTRAVFDILPDDSLESMLRERLVKEFREHKLDAEDIRRRIEAMALRTQNGGTAEVDIASGRMRHILFEQRLHAGVYDYSLHEEITFAPSP